MQRRMIMTILMIGYALVAVEQVSAQSPLSPPTAPTPPTFNTPIPLPNVPIPKSKVIFAPPQKQVGTIGPIQTDAPSESSEPPTKQFVPPPTVAPPVPRPQPPTPGTNPLVSTATQPRHHAAVTVRWDGPNALRLHIPAQYTLTVRNVSPHAVDNVTLRCPVPNWVHVISTRPSADKTQGNLVWNLGELQPGQTTKIAVNVMAKSKTPFTWNTSVTFRSTTRMAVQVFEPKLHVQLTAPKTGAVGGLVPVKIVVTNPGDGTTTPIKVRVQLSDGIDHVRGKSIDLDIGPLRAGEQRNVQLLCSNRRAGTHTIQAIASAGATLTARSKTQVTATGASITLAAAGPSVGYVARQGKYAFTVTNPSKSVASNVVVRTVLPVGVQLRPTTLGNRHFDAKTRAVTWYLGDVKAGQRHRIDAEILPTQPGTFQHRFTAHTAQGLTSTATVTTKITGVVALLMELVDVVDPVEVGSATAYEIRVTNTGSKTATKIRLRCTIPEGMEFRSAQCAAGVRFQANGRIVTFDVLPRLAARADVLYRINVNGTRAGDQRFRVEMTSDGLTQPVLREECTTVFGGSAPRN